MSASWSWPGSRWWRVDLHTHTPASHDFKPEAERANRDWPKWVKAVRAAGLDAAAITDHNTAAGITELQRAAADLDDAPTLFPGVELTASDGVHLLLLVDPGCTPEHIEGLLTRAESPVEQRGRQTARSSLGIEQILEKCGDDALIVGAHVNGRDGLLGLKGQQRIAVLRHRNLAAVEVNPDEAIDQSWLNGSRPEIRRRLPCVWCSDGHSFAGLGRRFTWVKMTRPDLEGLRLALLDGAASLMPAAQEAPGNPNVHASLAIESITVHKGKFIGRASPVTVALNPWLNAIIGGRGTGKSTLIDFCRKALRREAELDGSDRSEEGSLRTLFDRRMRAPASRREEGLLTKETHIELVAVICVEIARSLFVHKSPGGYFRRIGSSKREMSPEVLARLFQERSQSRVIRFDESPVPGASPEQLDDGLTRRFIRDGRALDETALRKLRIAVADDEDGAVRLTIAGVLLCTREPGQWLPHAQIQAVSYLGERRDINYQSDARDLDGPIDEQVLEALHFVRRNMRVAATKAMARVERPQFSERAVFEALVNAVAHRDYSMAGARVRLHLFGNRLELHVPGALANTLTPDSMDSRQYSRNELIVSLLARCRVSEQENLVRSHMMDRRGEGVPIILDESRELSGRVPEYTLLDDSELRLVIWAAALPESRTT